MEYSNHKIDDHYYFPPWTVGGDFEQTLQEETEMMLTDLEVGIISAYLELNKYQLALKLIAGTIRVSSDRWYREIAPIIPNARLARLWRLCGVVRRRLGQSRSALVALKTALEYHPTLDVLPDLQDEICELRLSIADAEGVDPSDIDESTKTDTEELQAKNTAYELELYERRIGPK